MGRTAKSNTAAAAADQRKKVLKFKLGNKRPRKTVPAAPAQPEAKKRRWHAGTVALREIRRYQRSTDALLRHIPFIRIVRNIAGDFRQDVRFQKRALRTLQAALEQEIISNFEAGQIECIHAKRVTVDARDFDTARQVRNILQGAPVGAVASSGTFAQVRRAAAPVAAASKRKASGPKKQAKAKPAPAQEPADDADDAADDDASEEEATAAANALVHAVAQETTVRADEEPAAVPSKAVASPAKARPQFDADDMSVFQ